MTPTDDRYSPASLRHRASVARERAAYFIQQAERLEQASRELAPTTTEPPAKSAEAPKNQEPGRCGAPPVSLSGTTPHLLAKYDAESYAGVVG